jgi:hypothetical protein
MNPIELQRIIAQLRQAFPSNEPGRWLVRFNRRDLDALVDHVEDLGEALAPFRRFLDALGGADGGVVVAATPAPAPVTLTAADIERLVR